MAPAPLLFLDDAKVPNCRKNNGFVDLGNYSEWPKVAGAVIQALQLPCYRAFSASLEAIPFPLHDFRTILTFIA